MLSGSQGMTAWAQCPDFC